jgi:hypothetical protein
MLLVSAIFIVVPACYRSLILANCCDYDDKKIVLDFVVVMIASGKLIELRCPQFIVLRLVFFCVFFFAEAVLKSGS